MVGRALGLVFLTAAAAAVGCGGGSGDFSDAGLSDADQPDAELSDAELPDAELPDAELPDAEGSDAEQGTLEGHMFLAEIDDTTDRGYANAQFGTAPVLGTPIGTAGDCVLYNLSVDPPGGISAGTGTFTGLKTSLTMAPSGPPDVFYDPSPPVQPDLFDTGNPVSVTFPGADFPAVTATANVPAAVVGYTPPASISRSGGVTFTWTAGTGSILIVIASLDTSALVDYRLFECRTADDGSMALPASLTSMVPAGDNLVGILMYRIDSDTVSVANGGTFRFEVGQGIDSDSGWVP